MCMASNSMLLRSHDSKIGCHMQLMYPMHARVMLAVWFWIAESCSKAVQSTWECHPETLAMP